MATFKNGWLEQVLLGSQEHAAGQLLLYAAEGQVRPFWPNHDVR